VNEVDSDQVLVQVVELDQKRQIGWGTNVAERLGDRADDVRRAITSGGEVVANSVAELQAVQGWRLAQASATFAVTLTAEAGAIVSKASAEATFEVTVTFQRDQ
jgi:hypothetical protein